MTFYWKKTCSKFAKYLEKTIMIRKNKHINKFSYKKEFKENVLFNIVAYTLLGFVIIFIGTIIGHSIRFTPIYIGKECDNYSLSVNESRKNGEYLWQYILETNAGGLDSRLDYTIFAERDFQNSIFRFRNQIRTDFCSSHIVMISKRCRFVSNNEWAIDTYSQTNTELYDVNDSIQVLWLYGKPIPEDTIYTNILLLNGIKNDTVAVRLTKRKI